MNILPAYQLFNESTFVTEQFDYVTESYLNEHIQILKEAEEPVQKEGFLERILRTIIKLIGLASRVLTSITRFIKSLLGKDTKSADQICDEVGVKKNPDAQEQKVNIEVDPESELTIGEVDVAIKPFITSFKDGKIIISSKSVIKNAIQAGSHTMIKGKDSTRFFTLKGTHNLVFKLMQTPDADDKLKRVATELVGDKELSPEASSALDELINMNTLAQKMTLKNFEIDADRLTSFTDTVNAVHGIMKKYDNPESNIFKGNLEKMNQFAKLCNEIQFGLNTITQSMRNVYLIDPEYIGCVKDIDVLAAFAEKCINGAMPVKYIATNLVLISSPELHGNADAMKPIVGQTRTVLFPPNQNYVLKIALSGMGIRANEAEYKIYQKIKGTPAEKYFAAIINLTDNKCVSAMEKINNRRKPKVNELKQFKAELAKVVAENDIPLDINADMHFDNVRFRDNGQAVTIDYGMAMRTAN